MSADDPFDDALAADAGRSPGRLERFSRRTRFALTTAGGLLCLALLDARTGLVPRAWSPTALEWLFALTLSLLWWYLGYPLAAGGRRARRYWRRFARHRAALLGLAYLGAVLAVGLVAPLFLATPRVHSEIAYQPPLGFTVPTYLAGSCLGAVVDGACHATWAHPLGTTGDGKDLLVLAVLGMRVTMAVGLVAAALVVAVGTTVGTVAAYAGGWVDEALMRYVDIQRTIPAFFLYLLAAYFFGGSLLSLVLIFGLTGWGNTARLVRSEALQRAQEPYVDAARSAGAGALYVVRRHLVPNVSATVVTNATLLVPTLLLAQAGLAFLGLGDPTAPSWGQVIATGRSGLPTAWWVSTVPGAFLFLAILAFNFVGDALHDALDPRGGDA